MNIITLDCNVTFIVNVFGGRNVCDVDFKFDSKKEFEDKIYCDSSLFY